MEKISRRAFLKTAGAAALAVGAVGTLSGCSLSGLVAAVTPVFGDNLGHAAENANGVLYALNNDCLWWTRGEARELTLLRITFQVKNTTDHEVTFRASDISRVTIDGHTARVVLDPTELNCSETGGDGPLFDKTTGSRTYAPSNDMTPAVNASLYFAPVYAEGEETIKGQWSTCEMEFTLAGKTSTFVLTMDAERHVTSARK